MKCPKLKCMFNKNFEESKTKVPSGERKEKQSNSSHFSSDQIVKNFLNQ